MKNSQDKIYNFDKFRFDAEQFALYYNDKLIKNIGEKPLRVLAVLLENAKKLTSHDQIIEDVWQDNASGVNSVHIAQYISKLRKVFSEYAPDKLYIETIKGRGYMFIEDTTIGNNTPVENKFLPNLHYEPSEYLPDTAKKRSF